ncbi:MULTISPECIES: anti-sigma factor domain-containing protein [Marinobacter]|uniref:anti-sigma factor n=1 Tax=Marinobacter TaxID=2742 RepID=UPI000DAECD3C|nr:MULTISPECIES: anti-sigma factor [Marinobacter]
MKRTPERIERLAAEYALGALKGPARRRFERWMMESWSIRQEVWYWEKQLAPLAEAVPAEDPPERVWRAIEQRLWPETAAPRRTGPSWLWAGWSLAATAVVLVLAVLLVNQPQAPEGPLLSGAVVPEEGQDPLWLVSEGGPAGQLSLQPVAAQPAEGQHDYELWVVPKDGNPMSLGVIPVGEDSVRITLTPETRAALAASRTLAISLEPKGGSTTGAPTGPILHITRLHELQ